MPCSHVLSHYVSLSSLFPLYKNIAHHTNQPVFFARATLPRRWYLPASRRVTITVSLVAHAPPTHGLLSVNNKQQLVVVKTARAVVGFKGLQRDISLVNTLLQLRAGTESRRQYQLAYLFVGDDGCCLSQIIIITLLQRPYAQQRTPTTTTISLHSNQKQFNNLTNESIITFICHHHHCSQSPGQKKYSSCQHHYRNTRSACKFTGKNQKKILLFGPGDFQTLSNSPLVLSRQQIYQIVIVISSTDIIVSLLILLLHTIVWISIEACTTQVIIDQLRQQHHRHHHPSRYRLPTGRQIETVEKGGKTEGALEIETEIETGTAIGCCG